MLFRSICEDADLELTARCLVFGLMLNGGRTCIAPRRVFVPAALKNDLEEHLLELARESPFVNVRPETSRILSELIGEAQQSDARILCGELDRDGSRIRPIILTDAKPGMTLLRADVFAPILSLVGVADMEQALAWNDLCPYALGAAVFGGRDARELAGRINAGVVVINDTIVPHADPRLPFAPRGASGFGVTRGAEGLLELTRPKAISRRTGRFRPHLEPRRPDDGRFFCEYLLAAHAGCAWSRIRAVGRFMRLLIKRSRSNGAS